MSKAFTKESDGPEELPEERDGEDEPEGLQIPAGAKNYMTPAGEAKLRTELKKLLYDERPKLVQTVQWAASNGDRSENADYIYGKRRLREIDRRIRFLTKRLEKAEIIDPGTQSSDRVLFGATVTIQNEEGVEKIYRIVGIDEADPRQGDLSWTSPVARALLQGRVGEAVQVRTPRGDEELEILSIRYISPSE